MTGLDAIQVSPVTSGELRRLALRQIGSFSQLSQQHGHLTGLVHGPEGFVLATAVLAQVAEQLVSNAVMAEKGTATPQICSEAPASDGLFPIILQDDRPLSFGRLRDRFTATHRAWQSAMSFPTARIVLQRRRDGISRSS